MLGWHAGHSRCEGDVWLDAGEGRVADVHEAMLCFLPVVDRYRDKLTYHGARRGEAGDARRAGVRREEGGGRREEEEGEEEGESEEGGGRREEGGGRREEGGG